MSDDGSEGDFKEEGPSIGTYQGDRNESKQRHGKGQNTFPNGDVYRGTYEKGKRQGSGTYSFVSGARYTGGYERNERHGKGRMVYPDGSRYSGDWKNGKRDGYGTFWYPNGDKYAGEWVKDRKHGDGVYTFQGTLSQKKGTWVEGSLTGPGEIVHADHIISGNFASNEILSSPVTVRFLSTDHQLVIRDADALLQQVSGGEQSVGGEE